MSTSTEWIHCKNFVPTDDHFSFKARKELKNGSYRIPFEYDGNKLWMETYRHRNPFGLSRGKPDDEENFNKKVTCSLSFDLQSKRGKAFLDSMDAFQEYLVDKAYENRVEWGLVRKAQASSKTREQIAEMMNPIVRIPYDKDGNVIDTYPPTFRVEFFSVKDEEGRVKGITTEVYGQTGQLLEEVNENTVPPGSDAKVIMGAMHLYVQPLKSFGVTFRLHQLRVFPGASLPTGRCLIQDDPDSSDDEARDAPEVPEDAGETATAADEEDSDAGPSRPKLSLGRTRK